MRSSWTAGPSPGPRGGVGHVGSRGSGGARSPGRPSAYGPGGRLPGACARSPDDPVRGRRRSGGRSRAIACAVSGDRVRGPRTVLPRKRVLTRWGGVRADPGNSEPGGRVRGTVIFVRVSKSFPQRWESDERDRSRWGEGAVHAGAGRRFGGGAVGEPSGPETALRPPASRAAPRSHRRPRTPPGARAGRARPATLRPGRWPLGYRGPVAVPGRAPARAPRPTEPLPAAADRAGVTRGPTPGTGTRPEAARGRTPYAPRAPRVRRVRRSGRRSPSRRDRRGAALGARSPAGPPGRPVVPPNGARRPPGRRAPPRSGRAAGTRHTVLVRAPREAADRPGDARCAVLRPRRGHRAGRPAREAGPGRRARRGHGRLP